MSVEADAWRRLCALTPARIALGRAGPALPTAEVLRFALAHAQARDAIHTPLDLDRLDQDLRGLGLTTLRVASAAPDRDVYLRRPDRGRRLAVESRERLAQYGEPRPDLVLVVADGLSAAAVEAQAAPVIAALGPFPARRGGRNPPAVIASQGRVALGDEIGALMGATVVAVLLGERPGLSSPASLGIYVTYGPRIGRTDAERNCISNIRPEGLTPQDAAHKLAWLIDQAMARRLTGVALKDESDGIPRLA